MSTYDHFFEWVRPKAGAIAFIKFKGPMSSEEFGAQLAEAGIGIKPAYCFMDVVVDDVDYFRIVSTAQCLSRKLCTLERAAITRTECDDCMSYRVFAAGLWRKDVASGVGCAD